MGKQRQSNYELLRILLMIAVPLYHMMIYAGIIYMPYNDLTTEALMICSGSAIVADYAFMAMSAFFLIEDSRKKSVISRFLVLLVQVLFIFLVKIITIRGILTFPEGDFYVRDFFIKGSWWFIYVYFVILLIYPFLNKIIFRLKHWQLLGVCMLFGGWFLINGGSNDVHHLNDLVAFLFTYFVMGYLKRGEYQRYFGLKNKRSFMVAIYLIGYIVTFGVLLWAKQPSSPLTDEAASDLVRVLVGKYSFIQCIMGIAVFLLFRSVKIKTNKWINGLATNVFYVFLLHETVMAIFWYFGKMRTIDNHLPYSDGIDVLVWCVIYILCSFAFAGIIRFLYEGLIKKIAQKCIDKFCSLSMIQKIDSVYWRREATENDREHS